jgi:hypothetical protein
VPMLKTNIDRSRRIFPMIDPGVTYNEVSHTWTFSSGYKYQFGHCADPGDWEIYQGNEYTHIAFDELTQFMEEQYDQICTRLRVSDPVLHKMLKVRAMSNPVMNLEGMGNAQVRDPQWVKNRFVKPAPQGGVLLYRDVKLSSGEMKRWTRVYLRATLRDNPDPLFREQYEFQLRNKPRHIQKALIEGDWDLTEGSYYASVWDRRLHLVRPFKIPDHWARFRSMDWGFKAPGCIHWWAMDDDENLYCERELTFQGKTASYVAQRVKDIEERLGLWAGKRSGITGPADTQLWEKRGESGMSKAEEFMAAGVQWVGADKRSRARNAERVYERLADHEDGTTTPGMVFFETCSQAIQTIPSIQVDPKNPEEPMDGGEDHWHDSVCYAAAFASRGRRGIPKRKSPGDDWEEHKSTAQNRGSYGYGQH